jgi:hypothetical protein
VYIWLRPRMSLGSLPRIVSSPSDGRRTFVWLAATSLVTAMCLTAPGFLRRAGVGGEQSRRFRRKAPPRNNVAGKYCVFANERRPIRTVHYVNTKGRLGDNPYASLDSRNLREVTEAETASVLLASAKRSASATDTEQHHLNRHQVGRITERLTLNRIAQEDFTGAVDILHAGITITAPHNVRLLDLYAAIACAFPAVGLKQLLMFADEAARRWAGNATVEQRVRRWRDDAWRERRSTFSWKAPTEEARPV